MSSKALPVSYIFKVNVDLTWREKVGGALRRLAGRVDKRATLALDIYTDPGVDDRIIFECIRTGLRVMEEGVDREVRHAATEVILERHFGASRET